MNNLDWYNSWAEVPKNAQKPFDNGNFKGTDINTMWRIKVLTEKFGACGIGWYYNIKRLWSETPENSIDQSGERLSFAEIELFVKDNGEWSKPIAGTGGNKMLAYVKSKDYYKSSDEAYKMAVTDALGNACRNLGIGANTYWANDKTKYADEQDKEPSKEELLKADRAKIIEANKPQEMTVAELKALASDYNCLKLGTAKEEDFKEFIKELKQWKSSTEK